jgi:hypothetical protein
MDHYARGRSWYDHSFIIGHCQLLFHKYHQPDVAMVNVMFSNSRVHSSEVSKIDPVDSEETQSNVEKERQEAIEVRSKFRKEQRGKMRKQREKDIEKRSAKVGDYVVLEVDKRDIPHARGIPGVVFQVGKGGGSRVVTRHGIICYENNMVFTAIDKYKVLEQECVMPEELVALRTAIVGGIFNAELMVKTSLVAAYRAEYGGTAVAMSGCGCKKKCTRQCGCIKKQLSCGDGCICRGKCENPFNE